MKQSIRTVAGISLALALVAVGSTSAHAATASKATAPQVIAKADTEIAARIKSLGALETRLTKLKHLSSDEQTKLSADIQTSIDAMNSLKAKIDGETDLATLKIDVASITKNYRIYMLVMPSERDIAATDNQLGQISTYQTTLASLNARIATAKTAGKDTSALEASASDAAAKLADAQTQANAMIAAVSSLKPDMGDASVLASNKTAIASAKTDRTAMNADITSARKDIASVRAGLKTLKV